MQLHKFYFNVRVLADNNNWRIGQALFNELSKVWPECAEKIRGTAMDPFFSTSSTDVAYVRAMKFIENAWHTDLSSPFYRN